MAKSKIKKKCSYPLSASLGCKHVSCCFYGFFCLTIKQQRMQSEWERKREGNDEEQKKL